ncbi:MAG: HlyD family efflux transporter periplasmic adaptor subunit, partial [Desulfurobacteriaceae bacterium]
VNYRTAVRSAEANLNAAKASQRAAEETYKTARKKFKRYKNLYKRRVVSKQQYEEIRAAYYGALAKLKGAKSRVKNSEEELKRAKSLKLKVAALEKELESLKERSSALKERVKSAKAQLKKIDELKRSIKQIKEEIKSKRAQLEKARELLRNTQVVSPVNGYVAKKWKEIGDFVSPGLPVYSIYDPKTFYVLGWIDEDKIKFIRVGSKARAELEACGEEFEGEVISIGKSAGSVFALIPRDTSQGDYTKVTQRVPVKVKLKRVPLKCIKPGTNVNLFIEKE